VAACLLKIPLSLPWAEETRLTHFCNRLHQQARLFLNNSGMSIARKANTMQTTTETTVRVLVQTLPANAKAKLIRELLAELPEERQDVTERIVRRKEVAKLLGRSLRAVDLLRSQNILHPITMPGRVRSTGFRLSDVMALISGKGVAA
jgi:hypothetical protein